MNPRDTRGFIHKRSFVTDNTSMLKGPKAADLLLEAYAVESNTANKTVRRAMYPSRIAFEWIARKLLKQNMECFNYA